jgi:hypothetical protein
MRGCLARGLSITVALAALLPAPAGAVAKKGTVGVVEVEYEMASQGTKKNGIETQIDWHGRRLLTISFEVVAGDVQARPVTLVGAPKGKNSFAARTEATAKKNENGTNTLDAAIKGCKHDKDCEARVTMEFMNSDAGAQAFGDSMAVAREASGKGGAPRYQYWSPAGPNGRPRALSGTFLVDQYSKVQSYDPLCGRTKNICTDVTETKGGGPLTAEGLDLLGRFLGTEGMITGGVVIDTVEKSLTIGLPHPDAIIEVTEDVQSSANGRSSTKKKAPWLAQAQKWDEGLGVADLAYAEPITELHGELTRRVVNGYSPTMTVRWRFRVKP